MKWTAGKHAIIAGFQKDDKYDCPPELQGSIVRIDKLWHENSDGSVKACITVFGIRPNPRVSFRDEYTANSGVFLRAIAPSDIKKIAIEVPLNFYGQEQIRTILHHRGFSLRFIGELGHSNRDNWPWFLIHLPLIGWIFSRNTGNRLRMSSYTFDRIFKVPQVDFRRLTHYTREAYNEPTKVCD